MQSEKEKPVIRGPGVTHVVHDDNLARAEELLRYRQRANGLRGAPARIADDMRVAFLEAQRLRGICERVSIKPSSLLPVSHP